ncbi:MAG: stage 0 sporulation protein [Thermoanaerobaculales bacterium]|nr:stage 0 sporulation protein [Thermoanaerobaculales bacterium]
MGCCSLADSPIPILCEDFVRVVIVPDLQPAVCRSGSLVVRHDDEVVVETGDGEFVGRVSRFTAPVLRPPRDQPGRILRFAVEDEIRRTVENRVQGQEMEGYVRRRTQELRLEMRPVRVEIPLSGEKAVVFFSAEQRVDFRPLVRDLGRRYRKEIEMRALGVRDGARQTGGLGPCGRSLCCATFMNRFHSVTVRMAKRQNISLNPAKISGLCGRLMCCLAHEVEQYPELRKRKAAGSRPVDDSRNKP